MAPEQVEGKKVGPATDVYGLGTILYSCCASARRIAEPMTRTPCGGSWPTSQSRRAVAAPRSRADLEAICLKCLEKHPARRYRSARDLADDLDRFLAGEPTKARPRGWWEKVRRTARRHPAALVRPGGRRGLCHDSPGGPLEV